MSDNGLIAQGDRFTNGRPKTVPVIQNDVVLWNQTVCSNSGKDYQLNKAENAAAATATTWSNLK